jgi:hypothetical protein
MTTSIIVTQRSIKITANAPVVSRAAQLVFCTFTDFISHTVGRVSLAKECKGNDKVADIKGIMFFGPMPPHAHTDFVFPPPGCGRSVTDF